MFMGVPVVLIVAGCISPVVTRTPCKDDSGLEQGVKKHNNYDIMFLPGLPFSRQR
jgi:hypothetical protein